MEQSKGIIPVESGQPNETKKDSVGGYDSPVIILISDSHRHIHDVIEEEEPDEEFLANVQHGGIDNVHSEIDEEAAITTYREATRDGDTPVEVVAYATSHLVDLVISHLLEPPMLRLSLSSVLQMFASPALLLRFPLQLSHEFCHIATLMIRTISGGSIATETNHRVVDRVMQLQQQARILNSRLRQRTIEGLEQQLRMAARLRLAMTRGPTISTQLLLAVLMGLLKWAPPLVLNMHATRRPWRCCRRRWNSDESHSASSETKEGSMGIPRTAFYILISVVDCVDSILDIIIAVRIIINDSGNSNSDDIERAWALILLCMTFVSRTLGAVFGVVYENIDESDREATYFLVEVTKWCMEDLASLILVGVVKGGDKPIHHANIALSIICAILYIISALYNYKRIVKRLPWFVAAPILLVYACMAVSGTIFVSDLLRNRLRVTNIQGWYGIYSYFVVIQLLVLVLWSRALYWNTDYTPRLDNEDSTVLEEPYESDEPD